MVWVIFVSKLNPDMATEQNSSPPPLEQKKSLITHSGFIGIIGRPNVGKSTLLNQILGEKLSIISPRPQTTRQRLLGILTKEPYQAAFFDTPGIHHPTGKGKSLLNRYMMEESLHTLTEVDVLLFVSDVQKLLRLETQGSPLNQNLQISLEQEDLFLLSKLPKDKPTLLAINKIDLLSDKRKLLPFLEAWQKSYPFQNLIPISSKTGEGLEELTNKIWPLLPKGEALFEKDALTDRSERYLAAERIREQVFLSSYQEIPYSIAVTVDAWEESYSPPVSQLDKVLESSSNRKSVRIEATIHVEKPPQKKIIVGHQGTMIRGIGTKARKQISELLKCKVHLFLFVRVDENWSNRISSLREMGYA